MDDFNDKKTLISEFNEAAFQIARLNNHWTKCSNYATSGNLDKWKWELDRVWVELSADAKQKNYKLYFTAIEKFNQAIPKCKTKGVLYKVLQAKEIFLRGLQEDVGKGGKKKSDYDGWGDD